MDIDRYTIAHKKSNNSPIKRENDTNINSAECKKSGEGNKDPSKSNKHPLFIFWFGGQIEKLCTSQK